jgi:uracil-DNA glycosylase
MRGPTPEGRLTSEEGDEREELRAVVAQIRTNLAIRGRSGLLGVSMKPTAEPTSKQTTKQGPSADATGAVSAPAVAPRGPSPEVEDGDPGAPRGKAGLALVREELGDCKRCKLAPSRQNLVFGVGNPEANLVFVGEAPGADEDAQGEPFVGKAGQLLTKMIEAMGYTRGEVYICNVLKCRPPGNRNPEPDEVAACEPFLKKQLGAIRPRMIVALGKFAAQCLLRSDAPISRLRGSWKEYEGIPLMPTYHPAFLLRTPSAKREVWADLQEVMRELDRLGIARPKK